MRKHYLDNIRWLTVVIVVIYHVFYMYNGQGIPGVLGSITGLDTQYYDVFQYLTFPWLMFLLFMVSGISSRYYLSNHTYKEFIKSRATKLLVPSTVGLFAFQFIQGYINMRLSDATVMIESVPKPVAYIIMSISGIGVLWYIQLLWVFSLILIPIVKIDKDRLWSLGKRTNLIALIIMAIPVFLLAQVLNTPVIVVYRFGYYGLAFLLGYFVFSHDEVIEVVKKYAVYLTVVAAILGIAFSLVYFGENYGDAPVFKSPLFTTFGWFASISILGMGARYLDFTNDITEWMSKYSWGLYIFHYLGISMVAVYIGAAHIMPALLVYFISLVSAFLLSFILYQVISRLPFFRWAVLGISKGSKR